MKDRVLQAYKQAPWRIQIQWIGLFLLGLILVASITGLYLNISAQAATAGRKIQSLEYDIDQINNDISELTAELAAARSTEKMLEKAEELGFKAIDPKSAVYLEIPGYDPNEPLILAPPRVNVITEAPIVRESYKTSLWEWFVDKIWSVPQEPAQTEGSISP